MSHLSPSLVYVVCAAIYFYGAAYHLALWVGPRKEGRQGAIAIAAFALGAASWSSLFVSLASQEADAFRPQCVQFASLAFGLGASLLFTHHDVQLRRYELVGSAAFCVVLVVIGLSGAAFDPAFATYAPTGHAVARLTTVGRFTLVIGFILIIYVIVRRKRAAMRTRSNRLLWVMNILLGACAMHDAGIWLGLSSRLYLTPILGILALGAATSTVLEELITTTRLLRKQATELQQNLEGLRNSQADLLEKEQLAALGELSSLVASEIRRPVALMKDALARLDVNAEVAPDFAIDVERQNERLNRFIRDLLLYAKPLSVQRKAVDLEAVTARAIANAGAETAKLDIQVLIDESAKLVQADPDLLTDAVTNILESALETKRKDGPLFVEARARDGRLEILFHDSTQVFAELARDSTLKVTLAKEPRTRLGLAVAERIAEAHGGRIDFPSRGDNVAMRLSLTV